MHTNDNRDQTNPPSVLAALRALIPNRKLRFYEAQRLTELQASRLLALRHITEAPVPSEIVSDLARIRVDYDDLPTSGLSFWDGRDWVICLNTTEPDTRQRFTLLHEFKHIIDHGRTELLYTDSHRTGGSDQAEHAADHFAGCVLMPKRLVYAAWRQGLRSHAELAMLFDVSVRAIEVRLDQLRLSRPSGLRHDLPLPPHFLEHDDVDVPEASEDLTTESGEVAA
jgi:hypothetical protein